MADVFITDQPRSRRCNCEELLEAFSHCVWWLATVSSFFTVGTLGINAQEKNAEPRDLLVNRGGSELRLPIILSEERIGIKFSAMFDADSGLCVSAVERNSVAAAMGILPGDCLR